MTSISSLHALALAALLTLSSGCATHNRELALVMTNAQAIAVTQPCCASLDDAIGAPEALSIPLVSFSAASRHYDFGRGLAPFASYRLPADARVLEAESPRQMVGWAYGGDGSSRYVAVDALFFDAERRPLQGSLMAREQRRSLIGDRSLFHYFRVPEGAVYLVLATDPTQWNVTETSRVQGAPATPIVAGSAFFFIPGDLLPMGYRLANYGPVMARVVPNE